jgi:hypothetical protein
VLLKVPTCRHSAVLLSCNECKYAMLDLMPSMLQDDLYFRLTIWLSGGFFLRHSRRTWCCLFCFFELGSSSIWSGEISSNSLFNSFVSVRFILPSLNFYSLSTILLIELFEAFGMHCTVIFVARLTGVFVTGCISIGSKFPKFRIQSFWLIPRFWVRFKNGYWLCKVQDALQISHTDSL